MDKKEKIASLQKYAQGLKDRLSVGHFPKRDNRAFLELDLKKTEARLAKLKLEVGGA
jgi:hypothetical protein